MTAARPASRDSPQHTHLLLTCSTATQQHLKQHRFEQVYSLQMKKNCNYWKYCALLPPPNVTDISQLWKSKGGKILWVRDNVALSGHNSTALTFQTAAGYLPRVLSSLVIVTNERRRRCNASRNKMSCSKHLALCRHLVDWRAYSKAFIKP